MAILRRRLKGTTTWNIFEAEAPISRSDFGSPGEIIEYSRGPDGNWTPIYEVTVPAVISNVSQPSQIANVAWSWVDSPSVNGDKAALNLIGPLPEFNGSNPTRVELRVSGGAIQYLSGGITLGQRLVTVVVGATAGAEIRLIDPTIAIDPDAGWSAVKFADPTVSGTAPTANYASQGNVTFPFTGAARQVGNAYVDVAYVVVPDGQNLTMDAPSPAVTTLTLATGDYTVNGVQKNGLVYSVQDAATAATPFDQRGAFNAANMATFPLSMAAGDVLKKQIHEPSVTVANRRNGTALEYAMCSVLNQTTYNALTAQSPMVNWLAPAPFDWAGRSAKTWRRVDLAALQAKRLGLSLTGLGIPAASVIVSRMAKFNFGTGATTSSTESGYENLSVHGFARGPGNANYGQSMAETIRFGLMHFMGNTPWAEIEPFIKQWVAMGSWFYDQEAGRGLPVGGDGGHWQMWLPLMIMGLIATGRENLIPTIETVHKGNQLGQSFFLTAGHVAEFAPHSAANKPYFSRLRTVASVSGTSVGLNSTSDDPTWLQFFGLELRKADGTLIGIISTGAGGTKGAVYPAVLDRAAVGLSVGDSVYTSVPTAWNIVAGKPSWCIQNSVIGSGFAAYSPSPTATYIALNYWAAELMFLASLGIDDQAQFAAMKALTLQQAYEYDLPTEMQSAALAALPAIRKGVAANTLRYVSPFSEDTTATINDADTQSVKRFWDAHKNTLGLLAPSAPPVVGTVTLAAQTYPSDSVGYVSPHLGSTGRNYGIIPLSGTGTVGAVIQARAYDNEFAGAGTTAWQTVATVDGSGNWAANVQFPLTPFWAYPEVRVLNDNATIQRGTKLFSVGYIWLLNGQSEVGTGFADVYVPAAGRPTVTAPNNVFVSHLGANAGAWVNNTTYTFVGGLPAYIANYCQSRFPNVKVRASYPAKQGSGPEEELQDANVNRAWTDTLEGFNAITYNGYCKPSVYAIMWAVNPANLGNKYGDFFAEVSTRKRANGTPYTLPTTPEANYANANLTPFTINHDYAELFGANFADTKFTNGIQVAQHYNDFAYQRKSWLLAKQNLAHFNAIVEDAEYYMAAPHARGGFDSIHPSNFSYAGIDGAIRFHKTMIDAMARTQGVHSVTAPIFDNFAMAADNTYFEAWSSRGSMFSVWNARSETPPVGARKQIGILVNGTPPVNSDYVGGRVRVYPDAGGVFNGLDFFDFDLTGILGPRKVGATQQGYGWWKAFPLVAAPTATGLEGIAIDLQKSKQVNSTLLTNPLPTPAPKFITLAANQMLVKTVVVPATIDRLVFAARFNTDVTIVNARLAGFGASNPTEIWIDGTANQLVVRVGTAGSALVHEVRFALTKATVLNHIVTIDAVNRVVQAYELTGLETLAGVIPLVPASTPTAWVDATGVMSGAQVRLFNNSGLNRFASCPVMGSVVISATTPSDDSASIMQFGGASEQDGVYELSRRMRNGGCRAYSGTAQVVISDNKMAADYNALTMNYGSVGNSGWTKSGTFTDAP